jgi:small-conductance mechanosensitive channel
MHNLFTIDYWVDFIHTTVTKFIDGSVKIIVFVCLYLLVKRIAGRLIDSGLTRLEKRQPNIPSAGYANRLQTMKGLMKSLLNYLLLFILILMILKTLGADITGIVTTVGVSGLAIGLGAQKLVKDIISGFFLLVEDQFEVGEYVTIGALSGVVTEIGMRITRLRDDTGGLIIIANGDISTVINHSRSPVESFLDVAIANVTDLEKAREVIDSVGERLFKEDPAGLFKPPKAMGVVAVDGAKTTLRVAISANPVQGMKEQIRVREALYKALLEKEIPTA